MQSLVSREEPSNNSRQQKETKDTVTNLVIAIALFRKPNTKDRGAAAGTTSQNRDPQRASYGLPRPDEPLFCLIDV
jgi:hypothetical protein